MGAFGSGRHAQHDTTSQMQQLDVRWMQRAGLLEPGRTSHLLWPQAGGLAAPMQVRAEDNCLILSSPVLFAEGGLQAVAQPLPIEWADCRFGGRRAWLRCPVTGCGRRVAILYGDRIFACRHCHRLTYDSQREKSTERAARRAADIRRRLGWEAGLLQAAGGKPRRMHWRTFTQLLEELERCIRLAVADKVGLG